jgi:hypothetical protein
MRHWQLVVLCWAAVQIASLPPISRAESPVCDPPACTKTVLVPRITYRSEAVSVLALQPRVVPQTVTMVRDVPEVRTVTRQVPELVPEERTFTETYTECRMAYEDVSREVVVMQPRVEERDGVRSMARPAFVQETRTISKDLGGWSEVQRVDTHGCVRVCRVWVPRIVEEQIPIDVLTLEAVETPVREEIVTFEPETRTVTERICKPVYETKTREVTETVCVERLVERQFDEVAWRRVAGEQVVNRLVPEAVTEQRELLTSQRTLVPQSVTCPITACERSPTPPRKEKPPGAIPAVLLPISCWSQTRSSRSLRYRPGRPCGSGCGRCRSLPASPRRSACAAPASRRG